jgi:PBP1b-binding outer membrane lipoprotein LpoB
MTDEKQENTGKANPVDPTQSADKASLPALNFATFIFSLNSSALVQLGMIEDPMTGEKTKNLPLAKQTIDILSMLEEKTRGNLDTDEAAMIKNILYDLRIHYVKEKG